METPRLRITEFDNSYIETTQKMSVEKHNRSAVPDEVFETYDKAKETIEFLIKSYSSEDGPFVYPISLSDGTHIGHVEVCKFRDKFEVGYHIGEEYENNGYATEALKAFLPYIMDKLNITEIYGICLADNLRSCRVLEKCDFEFLKEDAGDYFGGANRVRKYVYYI